MKKFLSSFYARISIVYLIILLILGIVQVNFSINEALEFARESDQLVNKDLAAKLAEELEPHLADEMNYTALENMMHHYMVMNPRIEIYLLNTEGKIESFFPGDLQQLVRQEVDLAPVREFLAGKGEIAVTGDDPRNLDRQKPFSASPVKYGDNRDGYMYVVLSSQAYDKAEMTYEETFFTDTFVKTLIITLISAAVIGLILFAFLTKRFHRMTNVVRDFEHGDYHQRVEKPGQDEIGELGQAFNHMADTIVANMEELKQTDRLRRELIANVSHDLRSPLASMQGYLETIIMKEDSLDQAKRKKYLGTILNNTQHLNKLVNELFELSKLEAKQVEPVEEPFAIAELAQDLVVKFQPVAEKKNISLKTDLPQNLPLVIADIAMIERALGNLIDNAVSYTPEGGEVNVKIAKSGGKVTVVVSDTGYGIPEDEIPLIFDRFYRVEKSRARSSGGTGLGLAITKKIIELHKSTISIKSKLNVGTTLSFSLRVHEAGAF